MELSEAIKEKFAEEVGWSFSVFEILIFFLYAIVFYRIEEGLNNGMWGGFINASISDVAFSEGSMIMKARIIDYLMSGLCTVATISMFKTAKMFFFTFIAEIFKLQKYVGEISARYDSLRSDSAGTRLAMANEAKGLKLKEMKKISLINGFGLVIFASIPLSTLGCLISIYNQRVNLIDVLMFSGAVIGFFGILWLTFYRYTARVIPHLVLERLMKGESVKYGDEL